MPSQSRLQIMQVASDIWIDLLELHYKQYKPAIARPQAPCRSKGLISERACGFQHPFARLGRNRLAGIVVEDVANSCPRYAARPRDETQKSNPKRALSRTRRIIPPRVYSLNTRRKS